MPFEKKITDKNITSRKTLAKIFLLLIFIAFIFVWNLFSGYSDSSTIKKDHYLLRFNLNELGPGEVRIIHHNGLPIVVMHRTKKELEELLVIRSSLSDPDSMQSKQPKFARNYYRSLKPEFFIAYAVTPKIGHPINYRLKNYNNSRISNLKWFGGFTEDRHTGYIYDKAGRTYIDVGRNLEVPNYKITSKNQLYVYTLKELDFD